MERDLGITDQQYLIALTIFFFSYAIFEVPSNVFLKRLRPSVWLSLLMLLWGVMMVRPRSLVRSADGTLTHTGPRHRRCRASCTTTAGCWVSSAPATR